MVCFSKCFRRKEHRPNKKYIGTALTLCVYFSRCQRLSGFISLFSFLTLFLKARRQTTGPRESHSLKNQLRFNGAYTFQRISLVQPMTLEAHHIITLVRLHKSLSFTSLSSTLYSFTITACTVICLVHFYLCSKKLKFHRVFH